MQKPTMRSPTDLLNDCFEFLTERLRGMQFKSFFTITLLILWVGHLTGQQSYFNVPSSDRTKEKTWFFQQQTNYSAGEFTSNYTFDYGINHKWEVGFNLLQLNAIPKNGLRVIQDNNGENQAFFPLVTLNAQRFMKLSQHSQFSIASVAGFDPFAIDFLKSGSMMVFSNYQFHNKFLKFTAGFWGGNNHFIGVGDRMSRFGSQSPLGFQLGGELHLGHKKTLVFDHISGSTPISMSTLGFTRYFHKNWIFSLGAQIPNHHQFVPNGIVVEFTRVL